MRKLCLFSSLIFLMGLFVACTNTVVNKNQINTDSKDQSINLYFSDSNAEYLIREEREIEDLTPQKAIEALIEGPKSKKLYSSLPKELEVSRVSVEEGIAYVYIHESVPLYRHGNYGSSASVLHIINSITATLILHEPFGIEKVKLEGDISDLLYGVDTNELLDVDMNLIRENSAKEDSIPAKPSDYIKGGEGKYEITGVNIKAQTPAGTFYTVEVTYTSGEFVRADYYAKDLGLVKSSIILKDDLRMDDLLIKVE